MIFSIGSQVVNVNSGKARYQQLQLLLIEDGDEALGNDVVEALQEGIQPAKLQEAISIYASCKKFYGTYSNNKFFTCLLHITNYCITRIKTVSTHCFLMAPVIFIWHTWRMYSIFVSSVTTMFRPLGFRSLTSVTPNSCTCCDKINKKTEITVYVAGVVRNGLP